MKNEIIIKKSRFITYLYNVDNDDKMNEILDNIRLEHKKATHICYAYIINNKVKVLQECLYIVLLKRIS